VSTLRLLCLEEHLDTRKTAAAKRSLMVGVINREKGMRKPAHKTPNDLKQPTELRKRKQVNLKPENLKTYTTLTEENIAA
jgi:hypothetical protein